MKLIACIVSIAFMSTAFAGGTTPRQEQDQSQEQNQNQHQNQNQDQAQSQSMGDQANVQTTSFHSEQAVSSAIAPNVFSTSPCYVGGSGALGLKGVSIGGGKAKVDPQCELREAVRLLLAADEHELAVQALCTTDALRQALGDACQSSRSVREELAQAKANIRTLLKEREADRQTCNESKDRIAEACKK